MIPEIKDFFEAIAFVANSTTLYVNFKSLKLRFPVNSVKLALDNTPNIENLVTTLFIRKQVMWEESSYEDADWCKNSLRELREMCDTASETFLSQSCFNDNNHFLATMLRTWGSYSDEAYKDIIKIGIKGQTLDSTLKKFRKNSYPIIITLLFSLPEGSIIRDSGFKKLELGLKNSNLSAKSIVPSWSIEL